MGDDAGARPLSVAPVPLGPPGLRMKRHVATRCRMTRNSRCGWIWRKRGMRYVSAASEYDQQNS
eukprot:COSAG01_NODE_521_length_15963_cov_76.378530_4_plen_64_part_00